MVYGKRYEVILHPDTEAGGFWVESPALGVVSQGETAEECLEMIKEAMELYLEDTAGAQANIA
ncbi:MAG: type II toxin-antitoxin system HicB family antitoxin [Nitrospirae bacterium]|nr:type II toxin-antitoxin system HicB family antitoxin [Nitrospirota bacterium]MBF0618486.1 type II toxin-antitoxin system HicB family antitoxin [Nitrospirota bacterium]